MEGGPEGETVQRAFSIHPASESPQDDLSDAQYRWAAAKRVVILQEKIDAVVAELARLRPELARIASALERRAS